MLKPADLRQALTAAVPELAREPQKLVIFVHAGRLICSNTPALSYEYSYTLKLLVLDYAGHADAIMAPLLMWAKRNQSDLFDNPTQRALAIRFEVEFLTAETIDLMVEIDLTERVLARPRGGVGGASGALDLVHVGEPPGPLAIDQRERWEFWVLGKKVAQWDWDPR